MTSLWVYFSFAATFCIGFTQTEKKYVKVINDNHDRIIEYKAKKIKIKNEEELITLTKIWTAFKCKNIEVKEVDKLYDWY